MVHVEFFGDNTTSILSKKKLLPFSSDMRIKNTRPLLRKAIEEARSEYDKCSTDLLNSDKSSSNEIDFSAKHSVNDRRNNETEQLRALRAEWEQLEIDTMMSTDLILWVLRIFNCFQINLTPFVPLLHRSLKSMHYKELCETFAQHKSKLTKIFQSNCTTPDHQFNPPVGYDFLLILDGLVTPEQQLKMYKEVRNQLTITSEASISTNVCDANCFDRLRFNVFAFDMIFIFNFIARESHLEIDYSTMGIRNIHEQFQFSSFRSYGAIEKTSPS